MDPVVSWKHLPEMKPLNVKRGFLGGLTVAAFATGSTALAGRSPADVAEVAVAALVPIVLLTLLATRANRRSPGRGRQ
jgi:hypothetical protein